MKRARSGETRLGLWRYLDDAARRAATQRAEADEFTRSFVKDDWRLLLRHCPELNLHCAAAPARDALFALFGDGLRARFPWLLPRIHHARRFPLAMPSRDQVAAFRARLAVQSESTDPALDLPVRDWIALVTLDPTFYALYASVPRPQAQRVALAAAGSEDALKLRAAEYLRLMAESKRDFAARAHAACDDHELRLAYFRLGVDAALRENTATVGDVTLLGWDVYGDQLIARRADGLFIMTRSVALVKERPHYVAWNCLQYPRGPPDVTTRPDEPLVRRGEAEWRAGVRGVLDHVASADVVGVVLEYCAMVLF